MESYFYQNSKINNTSGSLSMCKAILYFFFLINMVISRACKGFFYWLNTKITEYIFLHFVFPYL
jgi:hypothetical protein